MREVGDREVVDVHLGTQGFGGGVEEEGGCRGARDGPDDVRRRVVVPGGGFGEDAVVGGGAGDVGGDGVEALGWVTGGGLGKVVREYGGGLGLVTCS